MILMKYYESMYICKYSLLIDAFCFMGLNVGSEWNDELLNVSKVCVLEDSV